MNEASEVGEHLVCSPCGLAASRALMSRLAWPGGAAVALAKDVDYTETPCICKLNLRLFRA